MGCTPPARPRRSRYAARSLALAACLTACAQQDTVYPVSMQDGVYRVAPGGAYDPVDEALLLAVTARLDRQSGSLTFTLAGGSQQVLAVTFRPTSQWAADCYTMSSHFLEEVADLSPAPFTIEGHTFETPLIYAMCWQGRIILSDRHLSESPRAEPPSLILDHE